MTSPIETLLEHASKAQAAVQAQRDSAAQIAAAATRARDEAQRQALDQLQPSGAGAPPAGGQAAQ